MQKRFFMVASKPLVNDRFRLQRMQGKSAWTYIPVPDVKPDKHAPFGWVRVKGSIDGIALATCRLLPLGNGQLFLPVKAALRKMLGKAAGDEVELLLYADSLPEELPEELRQCLLDEPTAYDYYQSLPPFVQRTLFQWIYNAPTEAERIERIASTIGKLQLGNEGFAVKRKPRKQVQ